VASAFKKPELTVPQTPKCLKYVSYYYSFPIVFLDFVIDSSASSLPRKYKNIPKPHIPTTEELMLRKIEEEKERLRMQIEENRENLTRVFSGAEAIHPMHSTKPLTTPEEPHFSARLEAKYPQFKVGLFLFPIPPPTHCCA